MSRIIILAYCMIVFSSCTRSNPSESPYPAYKEPDLPLPSTWSPQGNVYKSAVKIESDQSWLSGLGIDLNKQEAIIVNASNASVSFGGSGINGALKEYVVRLEKQNAWKDLVLLNGIKNPTQLQVGEYAISTVSFGKIFHAYGPRASQVGSLEKAKQLVSDLYYNMLCKAAQDKTQLIVLTAISTETFASDGPGFTKQEFIHTVYTAMIQGIDRFQQQHPNHALKIIVNMWDTNVVKQVQELNP